MAKRLTEKHSLTMKLRALEEFADKIGISLEWDGSHMVIKDTETNQEAMYRDAENGEHLSEFPYTLESNLIIEE